MLDDRLGKKNFGAGQEVLNQAIACLQCLLGLLGLCGLLLEVFLQLVDGVELGNHLSEIIIGLGKLALLDGLNGQGNLCLFAFVLAALEGRGEGDDVACVGLTQCGVLTVEHGARANFVGNVGNGVDLFTIDGGNQIDGREVAGLGLTLDGLQGCETATQRVKLFLNVFVGNLNGINLDDGVLAVFGDIECGNDVNLSGENQLAGQFTGGRGDLGDLNLGLGHGTQFVLGNSSRVLTGKNLIDDLLDDGCTAETLVDDASGNVTLTEAGDGHLIGDALVRLVHF